MYKDVLGYDIISVVPGYYEDGESAYEMEKKLHYNYKFYLF